MAPVSPPKRAAWWFARLQSETASAEDRAAFDSWLAADPAHVAAYRTHQETWAELALLSGEARLQTLRTQALRRDGGMSRRELVRMAASGAGVVATGAAGGWWALRARGSSHAYQTSGGERLIVTLPDRTEVTLAPLTRIRVAYGPDARRVQVLEGQAYFTVAHEVARPFRVTAGDRMITALGTQFQVTLAGRQADVVLVEGAVQVEAAPGAAPVTPRRLAAGQRLAGPLHEASIRTADVERLTAWRSGRLVFRDEPLADVVAAFNRYSADQLEVTAPEVGAVRVSGSFSYEGGADFADALEEAFGLHVRRGSNGRLQIGP